MRGDEEEEESACVYGGSVCVCLSVHREVCVYLLFLHSHTPHPSPATGSTTTRFYKVVTVSCGRKRLLREPCAYVCVPEERQNEFFPTSETSSPSRSGARCVLSFQLENRERQKELLFCVCDPSLLHFTAYVFIKLIPLHTRETRENGCNQMCK